MRAWPLFLVPATLVSTTAAAQVVASADTGNPGLHSVAGVVFDSIHGRPLRGAEVIVAGTTRSVVTDPFGRFRLDSLAPGEYQLAFFHPLLDSMSFATAPQTLSVPLLPGKGVMLAIPSTATLVRGICRTDSAQNRSILVGRVADPETGFPIAGASVFVKWTDFEVNENKTLKRTPRTVQGSTNATGAYRVCGLPGEVEAVVYASTDNSTTSPVPVSSKSGSVLIRNLALENPSGDGRSASVVGTVKSAQGAPISGATVLVNGSDRTATTNARGEFSLTRLPLGTRNVMVRRLGFVQVTLPVDLTSKAPHRVDVVLGETALVMDPMYVIAQRDRALATIGFAARRKRGMGEFRTRSDFEKSNPRFLSDVVGRMRGVRIEYINGRRVFRGTGPGADCIRMLVDGLLVAANDRGELDDPDYIEGDLDEAVLPEHVAAIEVYSGASVPLEFENTRGRGCLTIVVWTRTRVKDFVQ